MQAIAGCSELGEGQLLWVHGLHTALDVLGVTAAAFALAALQVVRDVLDWHLQMSQGRCAYVTQVLYAWTICSLNAKRQEMQTFSTPCRP